jgi:thiamine-monophosphate kinase
VGIDLSSDALDAEGDPLTAAGAALAMNPLVWVLGGGEDHSLVATFSGSPPAGWRVIGRVLAGPARVLVDGEQWHGDTGWQSFATTGAR